MMEVGYKEASSIYQYNEKDKATFMSVKVMHSMNTVPIKNSEN